MLKFSSELVNLNLVKITASLEIQGGIAKSKGVLRLFIGDRDFYHSHYLKTTL